ncbi:MAG: O-methyltransferase [Phycisphaerales bacterium]|nr:O-methyltransferase [Phycisphaerales bacterium]
MSSETHSLEPDLRSYIVSRTTQEDALLRELKTAAEEAGIPPIWISPEQAAMMQIVLRLSGARVVVEVGTLAGYSAIIMARALPKNGLVQTIELSDEHADFAEQWIAKSDVADQIEVLRGDGRAILPGLDAESADAAFIDADKAGYETYFRECMRIVRSGGVIMADNAFAFGQLLDQSVEEPNVQAIRAFNDTVAQEEQLQGVIVPIGDGCWLMVKR